MFGWFTSWREKRRLRDKSLFRYFDGKRQRYGDPWALWRKLSKNPTAELATLAAGMEAGDVADAELFLRIVADVFGLHRWDDVRQWGLLDWDVRDIFDRFCDYIADVKKNFSPPPTPTPSSDGTACNGSTNLPTNASLDCSSTIVGSNCAAPPEN